MKKLLILLLPLLISGCWETESGDKVGTIVKFSKEGALIKTYEAELIRGGLNNGSGSFGRPFDFTVEDSSLIPIVQRAMENNNEVKIHYHREWITMWRCESDNYFLDSIEILK